MFISIDHGASVPVYQQISGQIRKMILSGILPVGFKLPSERRLADTLEINRSTVLSAYRELKADGFISSAAGKGTVVLPYETVEMERKPSYELPWRQLFSETASRVKEPLLKDLMVMASRDGVISFAAGITSPEVYPLDFFRSCQSELLDEHAAQLFLHTPTEGIFPLRQSLAHMMGKRGIVASPEEIMVVSGSQQGLDLISRALIDPGDFVIVEEPTFFYALQLFKAAGARMMSIPVDGEGMRVDLLEAALSRVRPKFIYTLPTFQNPSGSVMSPARRHRLLQLAYQYQIPILEDDPYSELIYEGEPIPSLKALDRYGYVIYLSTFSKLLFPGLRIGWMTAPVAVNRQFLYLKQTMDLHSNSISQYMLDRFLRQNRLDEHIKVARLEYARRRDIMLEELSKSPALDMSWNKPAGGLYLWCRLGKAVDPVRLLAKATEYKVAYVSGDVFFAEKQSENYIRLNFTYPSPDMIRIGIQRLLKALEESVNTDSPDRNNSKPEILPLE
jgi:DNA-binding transcriptional MocR family regulator